MHGSEALVLASVRGDRAAPAPSLKEARHMALFGQQSRKDEPAPKSEPFPKPETRVEPPPPAPVIPPAPAVTATTRRVEEAPMSMTHAQGFRVDPLRGPDDRGEDRGQRQHPRRRPLQGDRQRQGRADDRARCIHRRRGQGRHRAGRRRGARPPHRELAGGVQGVRHADRRPQGREPDGGGRIEDARQSRVRLEGRGGRSPPPARAEDVLRTRSRR